MRRTNGGAGLLLSVTLAIALAGCGSDETGSSAVTDPPDEAATATEPVASSASSEPTATDADESDEAADTGDAVDPAAVDPCAALDTVDLDGLLGEPAGEREPEVDDFGGGCTVAAADAESRGTVSLRVSTNAAADNYANAREQFGVDTEVAGLGDEAFASGPMVVVLDGDRLVSLQAIRWADLGVDGVSQADLETAAGEVLAALDGGTDTSESPESPASTEGATAEGLACTILADIDIEGLIGEPVGAPIDEGDGSTDECVVEPADAASTAQVSLTIIDTQGAERFAETEEMFGVDSTVDDLGDEAFHSGPVLAVLDGDRAILLWMMGDIMLGADIDDAELESVMAQVLAGTGGA